MDKSKQRVDLLAAGRKKLQQFRQKKDHKGSSSHAKSSSKASKPDKGGGEADEQVPEANSASETGMEIEDPVESLVATEPVDSPSVPSSREPSGGVPDEERDPEELLIVGGDSRSAVALSSGAMQEPNCSGSEQLNIDNSVVGMLMKENGRDVAGGSIFDVASATVRMVDDHAVIPSSVLEVAPELDRASASRVDGMVDDHTTIPSSGLEVAPEVYSLSSPIQDNHGGEMGFSLAENGVDGNDVTLENNEVHIGGVKEETDAKGDGLFVPVEAIQGEVVNLSSGTEKSASPEEHFEMTSSAQDTSASEREDGAHIAGAEGGWRINEEAKVQQACVMEDDTVDSESLGELQKGWPISHGEKDDRAKKEDSVFRLEVSFADGLESLRRHLYLTNVTKDFLQLQLAEQIELNAELHRNSFDEVSKLQGLVKEAQGSKALISEELTQCRSELGGMTIQKEQLEKRSLSTEEEIKDLNSRACDLQGKLECSQKELSRVSAELAECRGSLEAIEKENLKLAGSLISETDATKKFIEEKDFLSNANMKLASELLGQKERLIFALDKQTQLEGKLRETGACFEELTEENLYLSSSLVVHEAMLKELDGGHRELSFQARETGNQINSSRVEATATQYAVEDQTSYGNHDMYVTPGIAENPVVLIHAQGPLIQKDDEIDFGSSVVLGVLKEHLEEARSILENVEKSIQEMHSHSVSISRSGGRAQAPGVTKLIQAFESKGHLVDSVSDAVPLAEGGQSDDSYILASQQACDLNDILKQMDLDVGKVEMYLKEEQNSRKISEQLKLECETQRQQNNVLHVKIDDLVEKLSSYISRVDDLQNFSDELQKCANDDAGTLLSQVELLQKEVNDRASVLELERDSIKGVILEAIEKLNASTGLLIPDNVDIGSFVSSSVDAATVAIKSLHEKLETSHLNYDTLSTSFEEMSKICSDIKGRKEFAIELLNKFYISLKELANEPCQNAGEAEIVVNAEEVLELLPEHGEKLIGRLLDERLHLLSTNNKLESQLLSRSQDSEELNMKCNSLADRLEVLCHAKDELESILMNKNKDIEELKRGCLSLAKKFEEHDLYQDLDTIPGLAEDNLVVVKCDNMESDFCKSLLFRLEASVSFCLQKYEEAIEQITLSKNCLQEVSQLQEISASSWSLPLPTLLQKEFVPKLSELQEKLHFLSASNLQLEDEMEVLKEGLSKMEEALEASRSEYHLKASDFEQSEQRLSSVREKLSVAVAKGKGLVVQRDSLKQSLMEKSSELEKCTQELLSKEALLHEVEAKLKSCSEVERVEALESELSYIRNSATALRDSFLLKDSVLQRIEETLEDLDLPEYFHSKDIVEKIELLARLVAGNTSFTIADWDQKSSVGGSHSDSGFVVMDAWKDDLPPSSNSEVDELKRKYEELQSKLYGMAEHNDMLEQSLLERNHRVQKWEEVLNGLDMPPQLRMLEPEDRIEWLKRTLSEVEQERDSLQLKIENLEVSSDMLIYDLEESHKKISELSAEVVAVKSEKEFFSESLDKLRYEYLGLSEKAVQDELDRENLHRKLADLQEKLVKNFENKDHCDIEKEVQRLQGLIVNTLLDSARFDSLSSGSGTECLEELLMKLIDNYTTIYTEKSMHKDSEKELVSEESNFSLDKTAVKDVFHDKEHELVSLRLELDEAFRNLVLVKEERDAAVEKCHNLILEIETISNQRNLLQEERTKEAETYQSLVLELEATDKQRVALQEQLTQEEQKSASAREKLNVAVRKGKILVQQRDNLKQTIEEMNTAVERLKIDHSQRVEALESEKLLLMNQLAETEHSLQGSSQALSRLLTALHGIDVGTEANIVDPVQKVEGLGKLCHDLHSAVVFSEHEAKKSKRAAELLHAELNEVQERADILQEELAKAEAAKTDAHSRLEQFMSVHSEERKKQISSLVELKSGIDQLRKGCFELPSLLYNVLTKDVDIFCYMEAFMESVSKQMDGASVAELPVLASSSLLSSNSMNEGRYLPFGDDSLHKVHEHFNDSSLAEHLTLASSNLLECLKEYDDVKQNIQKHSYLIDQQATSLVDIMETVQRKLASQKEFSESLVRDAACLKLMIKEKETEVFSMRRNISLLYEACSNSILEMNRKAQILENNLSPGEHVLRKSDMVVKFPSYGDEKDNAGHIFPFTDDCVQMMADTLLSTVNSSSNINEVAEGNQRELKAAIEDLQRELQEKDIQTSRICAELVSQIREAEDVAKRSVMDLSSARAHVFNLEKQVEMMENDRKLLELRVNELKELEASSKELEERIKLLRDAVSTKDQEIESLMQALDEEESQMEGLENRNKELENIVQEKNVALESLEASRSKAVAKLSTTVSKFDELHNLSESLLAEIETLQSQVQNQDSEISFLRQEVTRCTNDFLTSQEINKKYSSEIHELQTWMNMMVSLCGAPRISLSEQEGSKIRACTDILEKKIVSIMDELKDLRMKAESKDALLQIERGKVEQLLCKAEVLETSLHEKETRIELFQGRTDSIQPASTNSPEPLEIEQMVQRNKVSLGPIKTHIRGGRKVNDQIAIAIDTENDENVLEDEDDDKAHGFKSLTMSRIVPRASRPIADRIDGIWVSGERLLMRQPTLRLGLLIYWVALHVLLASVI